MHRAVIAFVSASALAVGCNSDQQRAEEADPVERADLYEEVMHAPQVRVSDIVDDPARYDGQSVRTAGVVREMLNPRAFILEGDGLVDTPYLLVLTDERANPMGWLLQRGQRAIAVGIVRTGDAATVERLLGRQLEPEVQHALRSAPTVIARAVGRVHGDNIDWTEPAGITEAGR